MTTMIGWPPDPIAALSPGYEANPERLLIGSRETNPGISMGVLTRRTGEHALIEVRGCRRA